MNEKTNITLTFSTNSEFGEDVGTSPDSNSHNALEAIEKRTLSNLSKGVLGMDYFSISITGLI